MANVHRHVASRMINDMQFDVDQQQPGPSDDLTEDVEGAPSRRRRAQFALANLRIAQQYDLQQQLDNDPDVNDVDAPAPVDNGIQDDDYYSDSDNEGEVAVPIQPPAILQNVDPDPEQLVQMTAATSLNWPLGKTAQEVEWNTGFEQVTKASNFTPEREIGPSQEAKDLPDHPIHFFDLLFAEVQERLRFNTNVKGHIYYGHLPNYHAWKDLTAAQYDIFVGLLLSFALEKRNSIRDYWKGGETVYEKNYFKEHMSGERFRQILYSTAILNEAIERLEGGRGDPNSPNFERLWKINDYAKLLIPKFQKHLYPSQFLAVDESMIQFEGKFAWRQLIPRKPIPEGIKIYAMCDAKTNYLLNYIVHCGDGEARYDEGGPIFSYVWTLITGSNRNLQNTVSYAGRNFVGVADSYYSMAIVVTTLALVDTFYVGTINKKRGLPEDAANPKNAAGQFLKIGESKTWVDRDGVMTLTTWRDRKVARIISSFPEISLEKRTIVRNVDQTVNYRKVWREEVIDQPQIFDIYNKTKSAVDFFNKQVANTHLHLKSFNWVRPYAMWALEATMINSSILYREAKNCQITTRNFRIQVARALLRRGREHENAQMYRMFNNHNQYLPIAVPPWSRKRGRTPAEAPKPLMPRKRPNVELDRLRLNNKIEHPPGDCDSQSTCVAHCRRKRTNNCCSTCQVALCKVPCFKLWHTYPGKNYLYDDPYQSQTVPYVRKPPP